MTHIARISEPTLQRQTLTVQVVEYVLNLIRSGQVRSGDRLATEKELTERLGVSRTCVREAMKSLESLELIRVRPRIGAVVLEPSPIALLRAHRFSSQSETDDTNELLEFRKILEVGIASLAAEKATGRDIASMKSLLDDYARDLSAEQLNCVTDMSFHSAVAAASRNSLVVAAWNLASSRLKDVLQGCLHVPNVGRGTLDDHLHIYRAIKDRNSKKARAYMRQHLDHVERVVRIAKARQLTNESTARSSGDGKKD